MTEKVSSRYHAALLVVGLAVLVWSYIGAYDRMTWWLESVPAIAAAVILVATYRRFRLTDLAYILITIHAIILMVGGHYTYARVPLGDWVRDAFDLSRNHYDRLGHFAQGFVPAILSREILLRTSPLRRGKWLFFLVVCVCLAISAAYELIEWTTAIAAGDQSTDFLGTQGDVWDAQKDMTLALIGAILAQLLLGWLHDRQLEKVTRSE
jgi:putative membrane protein